MQSKEERYYSGPPQRDPNRPLPGEVSPQRRRLFKRISFGLVFVGVGMWLGILFQPESNTELLTRIKELEAKVVEIKNERDELKRTLAYRGNQGTKSGALKDADRDRHLREGAAYVVAIRSADAQAASDLMAWFITRWNNVLNQPQEDDRVTRRAALLTQLLTGMAKNLHPGDYIPWQAEFLSAKWLGELHFDMDGDGLPAKRSSRNRQDGFVSQSICHVAMSLNQSVTDAQVLMMPDIDCDLPENRISVVLSGSTFDDALTTFVRTAREKSFIIVEKKQKGLRMVLVGKAKRRRRR